MRQISLILVSLMFFIGAGCGSGSSHEADLVLTNPEYALIRYNGGIAINTENSELSCEPSGDDCYSFATSYDEEERSDKVIISLRISEPSGHRFLMYFDSGLTTGRKYQSVTNVDFMEQDLRFYATYVSPELPCDDNCYNAYNYSDTVTCVSDVESCKSYTIYVRENSEETLDFDFLIWNNYFLEDSEESRSGTFTGRIIIDKTAHSTDADLLYPRDSSE